MKTSLLKQITKKYLSSVSVLIILQFQPLSHAAPDDDKDKKIHDHGHPVEEIIITGMPHAKNRFDIMQGSSLLKNDELDRNIEATIGETLAGIPGISSSFFGAGASRPIIRGLGGDRIRMLINGISTADAGNTSPDHAVAVESLTAERIEILRGASTLIYGNNAIGGVVNVIDSRIPTTIPEDDFKGKARLSYGTVSNDIAGGAAVTVATGEHTAFHINGSYRNAGDFKIPSPAESARQRASEGEDHSEHEEEDLGIAHNSNLKNHSAAAGMSYISEDIFFGGSLSLNNSSYGVPVHGAHHEEEGHHEEAGDEEEENVRIKLKQKRFDLKGEINGDFAIFKTARLQFGYADYEHKELEGSHVSTIFKNKEWEARLELIQREIGVSHGSMGVQIKDRDFSAIGEEAFVPSSNTFQMGAFIVEEISLDIVTLEFGARYDYQKSKLLTGNSKALKFHNLSFSAGAAFHPMENSLIGLSLSHTQRAPTAEELYSNGPHFATSSYEVGSSDLSRETASSMEITFKKEMDRFAASINIYHTWFTDFIYAHETGEVKEGLEVFQYRQKDTRFYGAEIELGYVLFEEGYETVSFELSGDFVNAKFSSGEYIPRIPAASAYIAVDYQNEYWGARMDVKFTSSQNNITEHELKTDGYSNVGAEISYRPFGGDGDLTLRLQAKNLLNTEMRQHTSFLKDLLPMPGRNIRFSLNYSF